MENLESCTPSPEQSHPPDAGYVAEEDVLRANVYGLLSALLMAPPGAEVLTVAQNLEGDGSPFGQSLAAIAARADGMTPDDIADEFTQLFYGFGAGGELHPYASYYLTGFVYERPLSDLRDDLQAIGLARSDEVTSEPEDHIAFLLNIMHDLIVGAHGVNITLDEQKRFFERHIAPWAERFFIDLEKAETAAFYRPVGTAGRLFLDIEVQAFSMAV